MNERDTLELFSDIFKKTDEIKAFVAELTVLYRHRIEQLEEANADLTSKTEKCSAALRAIRQEVSEHGFCADWDEIVFQCDQALEYRKNTECDHG